MPQDFQKSKPRKENEQENTNKETTEKRDVTFSDHADVLAGRDKAQSHDYKGEAQNVNDDSGRPMNDEELKHAKNKAAEGTRQRDADAGS